MQAAYCLNFVILYTWYCYMHVYIKWKNQFGPHIDMKRGTRQGRLTLPLILTCSTKSWLKNSVHG